MFRHRLIWSLHPSDGMLLQAIDNELPPRSAETVRIHLQSCGSCRSRAEGFERGALGFLEYHDLTARRIGEPPRRWSGFQLLLDRQATELAAKVKSALPLPLRGWAAGLAGLIVLAVLLSVRYRPLPVTKTPRPLAPVLSANSLAPGSIKPASVLPPVGTKRNLRTRPARAFAPAKLATFIMLDDEPIGIGGVVRVTLPGSAIPDESETSLIEADVLLGDDGRVHAVRFLR